MSSGDSAMPCTICHNPGHWENECPIVANALKRDAEIKALKETVMNLRASFRLFGRHRGNCVQFTGKTCSCGFEATATLVGALKV